MNIRKRRSLAVVVTALVAALGTVLAGCGGAAGGGSGGDATIRWGTKQTQANWDPVVTGSTSATILLTPIYESMVAAS